MARGKATQFTKPEAPAKEPDPAPFVPDHAADIAKWLSDETRTKWWRDVLSTQFGQELAAIVRNYRPARPVGPAGYFLHSPEEHLGAINGCDEIRRLVLITLASTARQAPQSRRPGQALPPPHPVSTPQ